VIKTYPEGVPVTERMPISPARFSLSAHPNPFNSISTIVIDLPRRMTGELQIFNNTGQTVSTIPMQVFAAGVHHIPIEANGLPTGVYVARMLTETGAHSSIKLYLIR
jgi:hypothetical protein